MHGCRAWVLALALASSICGGAHGGGPDDVGDSDEGVQDDVLSTEQMHGIHQKIDANGDGKASMDEVLAFSDSVRRQIAAGDIPTVLEEIDVNRDGRVSLDEFLEDIGTSDDDDDPREAERKAAQKEAESAKFLVADTDKDGLLGTEELQSLFFPETHGGVLSVVARHALQERDRDGDGLLSLQEFWDGDSLEEDELLVSRTEQEAFRKLDADSSGKLDVKELEAWESGRFHVEEAVKSLSARGPWAAPMGSAWLYQHPPPTWHRHVVIIPCLFCFVCVVLPLSAVGDPPTARPFELADRDGDRHVTAEELGAAREQLAGSGAHEHLAEWAKHYEL
ncbi:unnamed protein product [Prorocentrum cordatum]|uniref:EF-hand domain-containing protein n=1 Tax=Prorocentrum cordatum TaxID=2364126 RepID=A0ABN9PL21_9DINO|nr:unnamed protein product [Polarella glacialis]